MSDEIDRTVTVADLASLEARLEKRLRRVESRVQTRLTEEAKTTRRHFDVVAERMNDGVKLVAGLASHHSIVLDDHETRIQKIERPTG